MAYTSTLKKLAENLRTTYENTIFSNPGNVGDTREKEVISYLTKVMAHKYGFNSGEIFDKNDAGSGQVDVIIYDNLFSTVFTDGTNKIVAPVESTYGIISVKSKMGVKELDHAIEGIKRFDSLDRPSIELNTLQIMPDFGITMGQGIKVNGSSQQNINCIFAFDTTVALPTLIQKLMMSNCIDLVIVPNKFCLIGRHRKDFGLSNRDGTKFEFTIVQNENSIGLFILFLQIYLSKNRLIARDIEPLVLELITGSEMLRPVPVP